jgi:hypothetical protein
MMDNYPMFPIAPHFIQYLLPKIDIVTRRLWARDMGWSVLLLEEHMGMWGTCEESLRLCGIQQDETPFTPPRCMLTHFIILHEKSILTIICHHFWLGLIPLPLILGTYFVTTWISCRSCIQKWFCFLRLLAHYQKYHSCNRHSQNKGCVSFPFSLAT